MDPPSLQNTDNKKLSANDNSASVTDICKGALQQYVLKVQSSSGSEKTCLHNLVGLPGTSHPALR